MNDQQMQSLLDAWYRGREVAPRDVHEGIARVMADVPRTRQQGRWLPIRLVRSKARTQTVTDAAGYRPSLDPATNGHVPIVIGRSQTMFSSVKVIIAGALAFALGSMFLVAQPFAQQGAIPGAEATAGPTIPAEVIGPLGAGYFTATDTPISNGTFDWQAGPGFTEAAGVTAVTDFVASDPRISGEATWTSTARFYPHGDEGGVDPALWSAAVRIENADGAWVGTMTGYHDPEEATREWNVVTGEGAYEGLAAVFRFVADAGYEGVIVPGGVPPVPEPATE